MKETKEMIHEQMNLNAYEGQEPYVFISYSHKDTAKVRPILQKLEDSKFRYWYDDNMETGSDFREELRIKIEKCSAVVLFVSKASMESKFCGMEIITAFKNNKKIHPIYLQDDVEIPAAFAMIFEYLQHTNGNLTSDQKYLQKFMGGLPIETMRTLEAENGTIIRCRDGSESITVPDNIHMIEAGAFKNCEKLKNLDFGTGVEVLKRESFRGCKSIVHLTVPQNVRKIGESSFRDCVSIESVEIFNDDIEIGERAFENCASLTDIKLTDGITEIYGGVFNSCKALENINLPKNLTILGENSLADCVKLKSITLPDSLTKIDDMAFSGCVALKEIFFSENLSKIGKSAFKDCSSLQEVNFPKSLNNIGTGPFRGCSNLAKINVDVKNKYFKSVDSVLFNKNKSTLICYPPQIDRYEYAVPDSVTAISDWAFCECAKLNKIEIPDSVIEIGEGAFYMCTGLHSIIIPESVTKIDDTAFRGCVSLEQVVIPDSVVEFGWGIFNGCDSVKIICGNSSAAAKYCDRKNIPHFEK